jgi:hypothetical protein
VGERVVAAIELVGARGAALIEAVVIAVFIWRDRG